MSEQNIMFEETLARQDLADRSYKKGVFLPL